MTREGPSVRRLSKIAAAIGCSVEAFHLPDSDADEASMTFELLRLWSTITEPQARQRILMRAREEADGDAVVVRAAE